MVNDTLATLPLRRNEARNCLSRAGHSRPQTGVLAWSDGGETRGGAQAVKIGGGYVDVICVDHKRGTSGDT